MITISEHAEVFSDIVKRTLDEMFAVETHSASECIEASSVQTGRSFIVSIYYTGTVYGEYLLALDESTAARIIGMEPPTTDEERAEIRDDICDALSEMLNTVVGEALVDLQKSYAKLTLTAPRVLFGEIRYPQFRTGTSVLTTAAGEVECHFCLDMMRLDLATSYEEAMHSLLGVNSQLKQANRQLAEQQAQLVHTEKMASVGILASGVAHEINNPLFFVDANLTTLQEYVGIIESTFGLYEKLCTGLRGAEGQWTQSLDQIQTERQDQDLEFVMEDTKQLMQETRDGIGRIKEIVQSLRDFSQIDRGGRAETDLRLVVKNTCDLIASQLPGECELVQELHELPRVACNAAEVGQALACILINAGQAIESCRSTKPCGTIRIRTEARENDVLITVEDNGCGISSESVHRIFEPFFTLRQEGQGRGLGLSIAYGILRKHQGTISVTSEPNEGSKFILRLPMATDTAASLLK